MKAQEKLINQLKSSYPKKAELANFFMDNLNLSRGTAYSKIKGDSLFTIDELEYIFQQENVNPFTVFFYNRSEESSTDVSTLDIKYSVESLLDSWTTAVERLAREENAHIFMISNSLPFTITFGFPALVKFRLYYMLKYIHKEHEYINLPLDLNSPIYSKVESVCNRINQAYDTLPTIELWGSTAMYLTIKQILNLYDQNLINAVDLQALLHDMRKLSELIEYYAKHGAKTNNSISTLSKISAPFTLILNELMVVDEYTILTWHKDGKEQSFVYHPVFGIANDKKKKINIKNYCLLLQETGEQISKVNKQKRKQVFSDIFAALDHADEYIRS